MKLFAEPLVRSTDLLPEGAQHLATGVGFDGSVLCVARVSSEPRTFENAAGATFPKSQHDAPTDLLVARWTEDGIQRTVVTGHATIPHYIQPLGNGFLLAGARCRWRESGPEKNGLACGWDGRVRASMTLGDGIQDLRTTRAGKLWVSYFDEGIFGNYGWASPGPEPLGAHGIVRFDAEGNVEFRYDPDAAGTDPICDAYAMNAADEDEVWTCFYTDFPIVQIKAGGYRQWTYGEAAPTAIAVQGRRALLVGDYELPNRASIVELGSDGRASTAARGELLATDGTSLERSRFTGIGPTLYAIRDDVVFRLSTW